MIIMLKTAANTIPFTKGSRFVISFGVRSLSVEQAWMICLNVPYKSKGIDYISIRKQNTMCLFYGMYCICFTGLFPIKSPSQGSMHKVWCTYGTKNSKLPFVDYCHLSHRSNRYATTFYCCRFPGHVRHIFPLTTTLFILASRGCLLSKYIHK